MPCTSRSAFGAALAVTALVSGAGPASALDSFPSPAGWPAYNATLDSREQIGPGVLFEHWLLASGSAGPDKNVANGPLSISIVTADLTNPFVALTVAAQGGVVQGPGERLSAMADAAHAEAGVNGDYFDIGGSNAPINALVVDGRLLHQPSSAAVFSVDTESHARIGQLTWRAVVTPASGAPLAISSLNDWSASTPITIITSDLGNSSAYDATEAVLAPADQPGAYTVVSVAQNLETLVALAPGQIGIAGHGDAAAGIAAELVPGQNVTADFQSDPPLGSISAAIGGGPVLVRGGAPYDDPSAPAPQEKNVRYPLTGAGVSADGRTLWLVVVDGRNPKVSIGLTRPMLAALFIALGAADAMAFDSGGSSEMVVRHAGDLAVGVVTIPSDGRERAIADGLFVVNSAPAGPPSQLLLRANAARVLVGSRLSLAAEAVDQNLQPVVLPASTYSWRIDPAGALAADASGAWIAALPGDATVTVANGSLSTTSKVSIVSSVAGLTIAGYGTTVPVGTRVQLTPTATDAAGNPVAVDADAVTWSVTNGASISPSGMLVAGARPAAVTVQAAAGGARAVAHVDIGDHEVGLQEAMPVGSAAHAWRFSASSAAAAGALDQNPAPDGSPSARLSYRFTPSGGTLAVYAANDIAIPGSPSAIACDVYGDGGGEWVRASYRNADGTADTITLARHVDWTGWRTVRAPVLPEVRWPIALEKIYIVQPEKRASQGALWLRNLGAVYPGP
jgi:hypothetical protein